MKLIKMTLGELNSDSLVDTGDYVDDKIVRQLRVYLFQFGEAPGYHAQGLDLSSVHIVPDCLQQHSDNQDCK